MLLSCAVLRHLHLLLMLTPVTTQHAALSCVASQNSALSSVFAWRRLQQHTPGMGQTIHHHEHQPVTVARAALYSYQSAVARTCAAVTFAALLKADAMPMWPGSDGAGRDRPGLRIMFPWRALRGWGTSTATPVLPGMLPACNSSARLTQAGLGQATCAYGAQGLQSMIGPRHICICAQAEGISQYWLYLASHARAQSGCAAYSLAHTQTTRRDMVSQLTLYMSLKRLEFLD